MRPINADALKQWADDSIQQYGNQYSNDMLNMFGMFKEVIDNAPTLEISPQDKALNEIIKYLKDDTVTWRDISDDIIIQILEDNGLW